MTSHAAQRLAVDSALGALAVIALFVPAPAFAQDTPPTRASSEARVEGQVVVPVLQRVSAGSQVLSLPDVTTGDLMAGFVEPPRPIGLVVFSNCPWELRLRRMGGIAGRRDRTAPAMLWTVGGSRFAGLDDDWIPAAGGGRTSGTRVELHLRIPLDWATSRPGILEPRVEYDLVPSEL